MDWVKTTTRQDEKHLSLGIWCDLYYTCICKIESLTHLLSCDATWPQWSGPSVAAMFFFRPQCVNSLAPIRSSDRGQWVNTLRSEKNYSRIWFRCGYNFELEYLEHLCSEDNPHCPMITHTIDSYPKSKQDKFKVTYLKNLPKLQIDEFWQKLNMGHIFWSCLIRCVNMKKIQQVLFKIQKGHDSVHRRTDVRTYGQMDVS